MWQTATRQVAGCRGLAGLSAILYPEIGSMGYLKIMCTHLPELVVCTPSVCAQVVQGNYDMKLLS